MSRAGKFDRRVQIWSPTETKDPTSGQPIETFALWKTVWARILLGSAGERFAMAALHATKQIVWRIRYIEGLSELAQFRHRGKTYKIVGIVEVDRLTELEVTTQSYE